MFANYARPRLCLLRNLTVFNRGLLRMGQRQEKTRTETSAGTRWIIGAGGGSVKPAIGKFVEASRPLDQGNRMNEFVDEDGFLNGPGRSATAPLPEGGVENSLGQAKRSPGNAAESSSPPRRGGANPPFRVHAIALPARCRRLDSVNPVERLYSQARH